MGLPSDRQSRDDHRVFRCLWRDRAREEGAGMRGLVGILGLVGMLITGGSWVKNELLGSDQQVCNETRALQTALATADGTYEQHVHDFELGQVKDSELAGHVVPVVEFSRRWGDKDPDTLSPAELEQAMNEFGAAYGHFQQALSRCDELGL